MHIGIIDVDQLDPDEYEYYEKVENGDLNWITDKFIALASPKEDPVGVVYPQSVRASYPTQRSLNGMFQNNNNNNYN